MSNSKPKTNNHDAVLLQFVGDISLNGLFCDPQHYSALRQNMTKLAESFGPCDLRIGNWEAPLWGDGRVNVHKRTRVCTTLEAAKCILPLGLNVALLANNHAYDCLEKGFENTTSFLKDNDVSYLGAGTNKTKAEKPLILTRKGIRLGFLNYVDANETNPNIPQQAQFYLNTIDEERLFVEIADLTSDVDMVIVSFHWGKELVNYPRLAQRLLARRAIEAGARIVACHHSHCFQGHEKWQKGHIFYSLGNFIFCGLAGWKSLQWPRISRNTAVATCVVSKSEVKQVNLTYLRQNGLILQLDKRKSRQKRQNYLNKKLKLNNVRYKRLCQREAMLKLPVMRLFHFVNTSGGFTKALRKILVRIIGMKCQ